jgi:hypothetical protein
MPNTKITFGDGAGTQTLVVKGTETQYALYNFLHQVCVLRSPADGKLYELKAIAHTNQEPTSELTLDQIVKRISPRDVDTESIAREDEDEPVETEPDNVGVAVTTVNEGTADTEMPANAKATKKS